MIKAIPTRYKEVLYASRAEARWAVFFDSIGVEARYEDEGYDFGKGILYLPDFYIPEWGLFFEVKGGLDHRKIPSGTVAKMMLMSYGTGKKGIIAWDTWSPLHGLGRFTCFFFTGNENDTVSHMGSTCHGTAEFAIGSETDHIYLVIRQWGLEEWCQINPLSNDASRKTLETLSRLSEEEIEAQGGTISSIAILMSDEVHESITLSRDYSNMLGPKTSTGNIVRKRLAVISEGIHLFSFLNYQERLYANRFRTLHKHYFKAQNHRFGQIKDNRS